MAYIRTMSETKTDVDLLVEIDVNAYNEIEVDIKRSGLCVLDESTSHRCGLSGNGSNEGCVHNTGFRSVVKRSLTLEKEVSRLKWREEYLTVCEGASVYSAQDHKTASASSMKNEGSKQCSNDTNNKPKYFRENSEIPQKSKEYKGTYVVTKSNISHAQETQEAGFYMETQGNNDLTNCQQRFEKNDSVSDELYKDKTNASFTLQSQSEEVTVRTYKKKEPKGISDDRQTLHPVSYTQNQINYANEVNVKNNLNDVMAKSAMIEEIGKKFIQFIGSGIGQKLMMEYSNGKQKRYKNSSSSNLLDSSFSLDMERIKMIVKEICNVLQTQSSVIIDEGSTKLQENPQERITTNDFRSEECFLTELSTPLANNTEEQHNSRKECSGIFLNKSERKIHRSNLKQSNRLHRNRYNTENYKGKGNTVGSLKQDISVESNEARNELKTSVPTNNMDSGKKSIFSTVKETFNAFLKTKFFEKCTEKHISSAQNKVEHQPVRMEGRTHSSGAPHKRAKCKNVSTSIDRGSHLSTRKLVKISKQTAAATHTKTLQKSKKFAPEHGIHKQRKKSQMPYSVTPPKSDKTTKWRKDDFQKLLFELLETLCSKIKKKDLQRLSVLLDILMKLQDQNLPPSVQTGSCNEMVAHYNIKHTKDYTRESTMRQLHTITPNKQDGSIEDEQYEACGAFFETRNSDSTTKFKKCVQTNIAHDSEILTEKNSGKKQEHTEFVANTGHIREVQTNIQSKTDTLPMSNIWPNNIHVGHDLKLTLNHVTKKKNINCKDHAKVSENCDTKTMEESENQNVSCSRMLLSHCRVRHQRQYAPGNHSLATKEGKNMNNFLSLMRPSEANQSYKHLKPSVVSWQRTDGKIKFPIYKRERTYGNSHEPGENLDKPNKSVTIIGLSQAYEMYNNMTPSDVCLQRTDSKSKHSEKQICTHVHKMTDVSSSLYKHAAFRHSLANVSINKINGVDVKINIPFSNEIIFPKTAECYNKSLKIGKTLKFYLPFTIKSNNYMQLPALESQNKEARHVFENEKDKSITCKEEINLIKEECISERKSAPNSYFLSSDESFTLQKTLLHNVMMEHSQSNEQKMTVCQSTDHKESACNKVETDGELHEASSMLLIESNVGKQKTHTNNCYTFQYIHKPLSPWKFDEQVGSFMFGAYTKEQFPVKSSLCIEDDLESLGDHVPDLPKTNFVSPCDVKSFDIKIISETKEHEQEIPNARKTTTGQLPTYFVFSAHNIKTNKEKMNSHITRKKRTRNRNIHDPQTSRSNEPQIVDSYASYWQRPSICLEPTICMYDPASQSAVEYRGENCIHLDTRPQTNNNIQNKRAKRDKVIHQHDFHTSDSPSKLKKRKLLYSSNDFKNDMHMNVVPRESISNMASQYPVKSLDNNNHINLNTHPSDTEKKIDTNDKNTEEYNVLNNSGINSPNLPYQLDERKLQSSSVELNDDISVYKNPSESVTNTPVQQSVESLDNYNGMKLNASSSNSNQEQNIESKEKERNAGLSHFPSKLDEKKSPSLSVRFKNDQRERVYPIETSSETSEEHLKVKQQDSDYISVKKGTGKYDIFSPENEQHDKDIQNYNKNDVPGLLQKNEYFGEESTNNRKLKSLERIKMLSQIDANDMAKQAATNLNDVPSHLVSENCDRNKHCNVSLDLNGPSTSVNDKKTVAPKNSLLMVLQSKGAKDQNYESTSMQPKKQKKVSQIIQKIFSQKDDDECKEILSPVGANAEFQSSPTSYQFENSEQQDKYIKQVNFPTQYTEERRENSPSRSGGSEYDKWRLSQTRRLLKTHHALIKEAHDLGRTASETGDSDTSYGENKSHKIKIGQSTWNSCTPADFLLYFRRGFRDDQMTLNNKVCFVERMDILGSDHEDNQEMIDLMITCHPLDFLVKLGYSAEEAAIISQDEEIKCRLYAAIREARIWANTITKPQAALLYLLAHKAKPKIMRYYLCLVESVINRRITNAVKLNELIDFLECLEDGEIALKDVFEDMAESDAMEEKKKAEDLYTVFHHMAEEEAMNCGKYPLSGKQIFLLQTLVSKYHLALQDHLALLTRYIGRGLIKNTVQLEAALVYLPHVGRHSVNIQEFEQYCGIKSKGKYKRHHNPK